MKESTANRLSVAAAIILLLLTGIQYSSYVSVAYNQGIVRGSGGNFYPDKPVSRQESAVLIDLALRSEERVDPNIDHWAGYSFKDTNKIAPWASKAVQDMAKMGYMRGYKDNFNPTTAISWGEAATLMNKYMTSKYSFFQN